MFFYCLLSLIYFILLEVLDILINIATRILFMFDICKIKVILLLFYIFSIFVLHYLAMAY